MKEKNGIILLEKNEFHAWLKKQTIHRSIKIIQNHHTYIPGYAHFNGSNHFERIQAMKNYHVNNNGWSDIAQNITTFPDGTIAICRPLSKTPAGIKGHNSKGICIEHLGNFNLDGDQMTKEHKESIIHLNAALCDKFNLMPDVDSIVYHHWYDLVTGKRRDGKGTTKTCPGTNFFGGNKVEDAKKSFIPKIKKELVELKGGNKTIKDIALDLSAAIAKESFLKKGLVTANSLNIRSGPGASNSKIGSIEFGSEITLLSEKNGWYKINTKNHWVSAKYVRELKYATVATNNLNVRTGPSTNFEIVKKVNKDDVVLVYEENNKWCKIAHSEEWVSGKYLEIK